MIKRMLHTAGPIGIDLGEDGARLIQLGYEGGSLRVLASARVDARQIGVEHDPADPAPDEIVRAVAKRIAAGGFRGRRCVISLPDLTLSCRSARLPLMPEPDLAEAVKLDAPAHLSMQETEGGAQIGWLKTGEVYQGDEHRVELLYFGAATRTLEQVSSAFEAAGLEPVAIEPHFVCATRAMTRMLRRTADAEVVQLVIDVCDKHSTILITRGAELAFCKVIHTGGEAMNRAIEQRLGLEPATVRELRRQHFSRDGSGQRDERIERAMFDAVRPTMAQIAREASLCLRHYSVTFRGSRPERCLLIGSEALEQGFDAVFADAVGVPTVTGDPLEGISTDSLIGGSHFGPVWAAPVGVAIRELLKRPPSRRRDQRRSRTKSKAAAQKAAQPTTQAKGRAA